MDKKLNSYVISIIVISLSLVTVSILQSIYSPCWTPNEKLSFGLVGIIILLITLINFPVGYFLKEKLILKRFDTKILFYGIIITGILIGFGIVRIVLSNNICL